ncbi:hypothetical protein CPC08DRAFT_727661 [Agrocybe pediades]|nr:hypothetical protein CPC08DRAFT_727661 [Agrocybe pediades]
MPVIGYAMFAALVSYLVLRFGRHLRSKYNSSQTRLPSVTPKAVSQRTSTSPSTLDAGHSTGWDWRKWTSSINLPRVPYWSKVPLAAEVVVGKAKAAATAKNLSVELLPTTGLPPPPSSLPSTSNTAHLVDVSTPTPSRPNTPFVPVTPSLTTGSTSNSFPSSPRTPSPSPFGHFNVPKAVFYPAPPHPSYPRPPSPHALLATTPPLKYPHRRSRSLGGVPVRRLSGNSSSGLRNSVDVEVEMEDVKVMSSSHLRGTSREHLLIDFTSSSSSDEDDAKVSPAASDIGVLPSGSNQVKATMVGRHVPLVDIGDSDDGLSTATAPYSGTADNATWKWFGPGVTQAKARGPIPTFTDTSLQEKPVFSRIEKLIDVDVPDEKPELASGVPSRVNVPVFQAGHLVDRREETLVDVSDDNKYGDDILRFSSNKTAGPVPPLVDLRGNEARLVDIDDHPVVSKPHIEIPSLPSQVTVITTPVVVKSAFAQPHPLQGLPHVTTQSIKLQEVSSSETSLIQEDYLDKQPGQLEAAEEPSLLFLQSKGEGPAEEEDVLAPATSLVDVSTESDSESVFEYPMAEAISPLSPLHVATQQEHMPIEVHDAQGSTTVTQDGWSWDEVDLEDPWGSSNLAKAPMPEVSTPDSDVFVYTGIDSVSPPAEAPERDNTVDDDSMNKSPKLDVLDKSPGGKLFATVLPDDEEDVDGAVPALDLNCTVDPECLAEGPKSATDAASLEDDIDGEQKEDEGDEEITPKPTPASVQLELPELVVEVTPVIIVDPATVLEVEEVADLSAAEYPDPELLPLPESPLAVTVADIPALLAAKKEVPDDKALSPSQTPTPPASPPPVSPLRFVQATPPIARLPSPRLLIVPSLLRAKDVDEKENQTPVAAKPAEEVASSLSAEVTFADSGIRRRVLAPVNSDGDEELKKEESISTPLTLVQEDAKDTDSSSAAFGRPESLKLSVSLPGSFPEASVISAVSSAAPSTTIAARLAQTPDSLVPRPSVRAIVRSPVDIALAMQLRPGLGAGADPAWMVRFLMAMFGWLAVVVSQGGEY